MLFKHEVPVARNGTKYSSSSKRHRQKIQVNTKLTHITLVVYYYIFMITVCRISFLFKRFHHSDCNTTGNSVQNTIISFSYFSFTAHLSSLFGVWFLPLLLLLLPPLQCDSLQPSYHKSVAPYCDKLNTPEHTPDIHVVHYNRKTRIEQLSLELC